MNKKFEYHQSRFKTKKLFDWKWLFNNEIGRLAYGERNHVKEIIFYI